VDERLKDIREGAGLDESRLNEDFLRWLSTWGNRLLWLALIALGLYVGNQYWKKMQRARVDRAFSQFEQALAIDPTPDGLLAVAHEFSGTRGVAHMATLNAADLYLRGVRQGLTFNATVDADGQVLTEDDLLSDEDRAVYLDQADTLYRQVFDDTSGRASEAIHAISAGFGLAAVAETREDLQSARSWYEKIESIAQDNGLSEAGEKARAFAARLETLGEVPRLYRQADLPERAPQPGIGDVDLESLMRQIDAQQGGDATSGDAQGGGTPTGDAGTDDADAGPADAGDDAGTDDADDSDAGDAGRGSDAGGG